MSKVLKVPAATAPQRVDTVGTLARLALIGGTRAATMSRAERLAATASEFTMYGLMFLLPLVGWGMLSAAHYPIVLFGSVHLPFILPQDAMLYSVLRKTHTMLAYLFFLTFVAHFRAILFHTLIVRDGILKRMA